MTCSHPAHGYLHTAPVPCPDCGGWLDRDGTVLDRATTIARYPFMAPIIAAAGTSNPDYKPAPSSDLQRGVAIFGNLIGTYLIVHTVL